MSVRWRRHKISKLELFSLALLSLLFYGMAWFYRVDVLDTSYELERAAAEQTMIAFQAMISRAANDASSNHKDDTSVVSSRERAGLLGTLTTPITSIDDPAYLGAKLTSINPNFAALLIKLLQEAGVQEGDAVAIGMTGSFPALNIAAVIACQTLRAHAIVISSLSASSWGANDPRWTWLDVESYLYEQGLIGFRSRAASLGGIDDQGEGLSAEGTQLLEEALERNDIPILKEGTLNKNIEKRWQMYQKATRKPIKAYINIGGGAASLGNPKARELLRPGLNWELPTGSQSLNPKGVSIRFLEQRVPVIHLAEVEELAKRYGMPVAPAQIPEPGLGNFFYRKQFSPPVVSLLLGLCLLLLGAALHVDWRGSTPDQKVS